MTVPRRFLLPALVLLVTPAIADTPKKAPAPQHPTLTVANGWFATVRNNGPTYGYFRITNSGDKPVLITGYSAPACTSLNLEEAHSGGINGKAAVKMTVAAKTTLVFSRGGYHLVCERGSNIPTPGQTIPVKMTFMDHPDLTADFSVREFPTR
ncbi:copper chaperone PCu(A)C [Acetobacteraceae bacterium KSS8]|uniref:Copper chaperone PCu(A)C n=1 Tax=Endosaccharibacter trunci TaxID=2812733 RepID=A0ABT1W4V3_9PROT|nr:copper chaperone PCu(A)C [Acetobacteraceae bacterium KSS8]